MEITAILEGHCFNDGLTITQRDRSQLVISQEKILFTTEDGFFTTQVRLEGYVKKVQDKVVEHIDTLKILPLIKEEDDNVIAAAAGEEEADTHHLKVQRLETTKVSERFSEPAKQPA